MIWPVVEAIYFLIGGGLSLAMAPAHSHRSDLHMMPFDPASAFVVVFGTMLLWPLLLALAMAGQPK